MSTIGYYTEVGYSVMCMHFLSVLNFKHAFQVHSGPCTSELYHMPIESGIM